MRTGARIYVAGPMSRGDMARNVSKACWSASILIQYGFVPFLPQLSFFWDLITPHDYEVWMAQDMEWLKLCDAVLRLSGESAGADREVVLAESLSIPVFRSIEDLLARGKNFPS